MTPTKVRVARLSLNMTQAELATALRLASDGKRTVRHWETEGGKFQISGPASVALELMLAIRELDKLARGENDPAGSVDPRGNGI